MYKNYCKIRDRMGYRDADVAKATGITKSTFSDWKSGRSIPKQDKLKKIADFLHVSVGYLIGLSFDELKKEYLEEMDDKVRDMIDTMHIIEEQRAAAAAAHSILDYNGEKFHLNLIYQILVKEDDANQSFKNMIDTLYYNYINNCIKKISDTTFQKLYYEKLEEELDKDQSHRVEVLPCHSAKNV